MKIRILTDVIPRWLVEPLLEHHEAELVVGAAARDELNRELNPRAVDRRNPRRRTA